MISEILFLVEEIRPGRAKVDDFGAPITIFLEPCTLKAVEGVTDAFAAADDAFVLIVAERTFIADPNEGRRSDITITDGTFAITFVA